ncbi:hypothetical protein PIB30_033797 [Stylosanthes scabra]|uniref:Uncharacterized protein n=1 Tax=Stylosanthes scabra TaxID=79078 RepID=A0ABU6WEP4_9FABA|nr:hypothetical protein [Stylosanthes scabra]
MAGIFGGRGTDCRIKAKWKLFVTLDVSLFSFMIEFSSKKTGLFHNYENQTGANSWTKEEAEGDNTRGRGRGRDRRGTAEPRRPGQHRPSEVETREVTVWGYEAVTTTYPTPEKDDPNPTLSPYPTIAWGVIAAASINPSERPCGVALEIASGGKLPFTAVAGSFKQYYVIFLPPKSPAAFIETASHRCPLLPQLRVRRVASI